MKNEKFMHILFIHIFDKLRGKKIFISLMICLSRMFRYVRDLYRF